MPIVLGLTACAHSYYYLPEIDGEGAIHGKKGGIVYAIPSQAHADFVVRVRSLGVKKTHNVQLLGMRLSFGPPEGAAPGSAGVKATVDPAELMVRLGGGKEIKPAYVHSKTKKQSIVEVDSRAHDVVELLYPLPAESEGAATVFSYYFEWTVHYGQGKFVHQTARFDRYDARPQQAAELFPEDSDYPYDVSPMDMNGWHVVREPFWWAVDPWWPWW